MNIRTIASFAIAILLGLVAVVMVRSYLGRATHDAGGAKAVAGGSPVVVAVQTIERGALLQPSLLKVVNYPADSVPAGAFTDLSQFTGSGPTARIALRAIAANEPIQASKVSGPGGRSTLSGVVTTGMRAISLRSGDVAGVAGFVLPGDRVDILLTRQIGEGATAQTVTQALAENVRVLGIDQSDDTEADKPQVAKAVTVEVTPEQAQAIALAQSVGSISLALRQVADDSALVRKATTVTDLGRFGARSQPALAGGPAPAAAAPKPAASAPGMVEIHVTRGTEISGYPVKAY